MAPERRQHMSWAQWVGALEIAQIAAGGPRTSLSSPCCPVLFHKAGHSGILYTMGTANTTIRASSPTPLESQCTSTALAGPHFPDRT